MRNFILSCESTVDLPYSYINGRDIPVLFYTYLIDGESFVDDMQQTPGALDRFYGYLDAGKIPSTSQINEFRYEEFFEEQLQKGDLLHIAFGTGMTKSADNAMRAAENLRKKYPQRKIFVVDSLCSSSGYGLLTDYAADLRDEGKSIEEVYDFVMQNRKRVHHQFFSTQLDQYRRSGRMSGPTAMIATILNICPIMRLNADGKIVAYDKIRGKNRAINVTVDTMEKHAENGTEYSGKCFICHSACLETAEKLKEAILAHFPKIANIRICDIGTIIASHCGRGTAAVFFLGCEREM